MVKALERVRHKLVRTRVRNKCKLISSLFIYVILENLIVKNEPPKIKKSASTKQNKDKKKEVKKKFVIITR
jgi:hypothetical protein